MDGINTVPKETRGLRVRVCVRAREKGSGIQRMSAGSVIGALQGFGPACSPFGACLCEAAVKGMYGCLSLVNQAVKAIIRTTYTFLCWQTRL